MGQDFSSITHNEDLDDYQRGGFSAKQRDKIKELFKQKTKNTGELTADGFAQLVGLEPRLSKKVGFPDTVLRSL